MNNRIFSLATITWLVSFQVEAFSYHRATKSCQYSNHLKLRNLRPNDSLRLPKPSLIILSTSSSSPSIAMPIRLFRKGQDTNEVTTSDNANDIAFDETDSKASNKTETLRFGGKNNYTSIILPVPADIRSINAFFAASENQRVLLTGGKDDSSMEILDVEEIDSQKWIDNARIMGGDAPDLKEDIAIKVTPRGIGILTVEVSPLTIIGSKVTANIPQDGKGISIPPMPEFQAILIEDYPRAKGPRPLVWLFNKIVYGGDPNDETQASKKRRKRDEKAMLRFWAERQPQQSSSSIETFVFKAEAELWLEFEFPRLLLRFFPLSKEKAEDLCSDAISKALNLNLEPAVIRFTQLYQESTGCKR